MTFNVALSGLNAASTDLNVTGNNIANVGTTGFKASRAEFADLYATSMLGSGGNAVGSGVTTADIAQQFTQGNITNTGNSLDLAISGNGYFMVSNNGSMLYTRAGAFKTDDEGYVINSEGYNLQGYGVNANGDIVSGVTTNLKVDSSNQAPNATSSVVETLALNSNSSVPNNTPFDASDSSTYNWSTSVPLYDTQGNSHTMTQYFVKDDSNQWTMYTLIDGRNPADPTSTEAYEVSIGFTASGALDLTSLASTDFDVNADGTLTLNTWVPATVTDSTTSPVTWGSNGAAASASGISAQHQPDEYQLRGIEQSGPGRLHHGSVVGALHR